jgi:Domain of unknown function (DUF6817)
MTASEPAPVTGERLDLLERLGFGQLTHDSHVPFLSHLVGTRRVLASWGCDAELCDAGLFHSVYGTEYFPTDGTASRDEVRAVIGERAERLAWLWCTIRRDTIDVQAGTVEDRHTGGRLRFGPGELSDVATLWAADTVEQLHRMAPDERAFADGLPAVIAEACPAAQDAVAALPPGPPASGDPERRQASF